MTALDKAYDRFARAHYVRRRLRGPEHVAALLEAAAVPPGKVDTAFWRQIRGEWLWGVSPATGRATCSRSRSGSSDGGIGGGGGDGATSSRASRTVSAACLTMAAAATSVAAARRPNPGVLTKALAGIRSSAR